jgi:hypothetical protein
MMGSANICMEQGDGTDELQPGYRTMREEPPGIRQSADLTPAVIALCGSCDLARA